MTSTHTILRFSDGSTVALERSCVVGRTPQSAPAVTGGQADPVVRSDDAQMSRQHLQIDLGDVEATATDLGSGNGTSIERAGERHALVALQPFVLQHDDVVHFGQTNARFTSTRYTGEVATVIVPNAAPVAAGAAAAPSTQIVTPARTPSRPAAAAAAPATSPTPAMSPSPFAPAAPAPSAATKSPFVGAEQGGAFGSSGPSSPFAGGSASGALPRHAAGGGRRTARPASFGNRLVGLLLDSLLYGLLGLGLLVLAVLVGVAIHPLLGVLVGLSAQLGILVIYVRALGLTGQTWGRKLAGVMVVGEKTGQPIGIGGAVLRCLVEWLVSGSVLYLGYFWMLWDDKKQTWHDKVADSVVIKV